MDKKKIIPIILGAGALAVGGTAAVIAVKKLAFGGNEIPPEGMSYDYCMLKTMGKKYIIALTFKGQFMKTDNGLYKFEKMTAAEIKDLGTAIEKYSAFFNDRWQMTYKEAGDRYDIKNCKKVLEQLYDE
jgi:hypothetical protein